MRTLLSFITILVFSCFCSGQDDLSKLNRLANEFPDHQSEIEDMAMKYQNELFLYMYSIYNDHVKEKDVRIKSLTNEDDLTTPYCKDARGIFTREFKKTAELNNAYSYVHIRMNVLDFFEQPMINATFKVSISVEPRKDKGKRYLVYHITTFMPELYKLYVVAPPSMSRIIPVDKKVYKYYKKTSYKARS